MQEPQWYNKVRRDCYHRGSSKYKHIQLGSKRTRELLWQGA